jgi:carbonic anhydrase
MLRTRRMRIEWLLLAITLPIATTQAQWKTQWSYRGPDGPQHWGDLDPAWAACKTGREQSPIDIRDAQKSDLSAIRFEYQVAPLRHLINNGYTVRVNYHDPGSGDFLIVGDRRYQLTQFHFHHPSEEYIRGKPYDMVMHLMHQASDGKIAGVAVLLKAGAANATIRQIWEHMPPVKGSEIDIPGVEINPAGLLPQDTGYYTYEGSLTAPPCDEAVTWFVLRAPVEISPEQIDAFARLYPHDVRPLQPLNGRVVRESR